MVNYFKKIYKNQALILAYALMFLPIIMMLVNRFIINANTDNIWYAIILTIGFISLLKVKNIFKEIKSHKYDKKYINKILPLVLLIGFLFWTLICCLFSNNKSISFLGDTYRKEGFITYIGYAGIIILGMFLSNKNEYVKKVLKYFIIVAVVISLCSYTKNRTLNILFFRGLSQYQAVFHNINHFAYYLTIVIMLNVGIFIGEKNKKKKLVYLIFYIVLTYTLIKNNTFGSYIAISSTLVLLLIYTLFKRKNVKSVVILIAFWIFLSIIVSNANGNIVAENSNAIINDISSIVNSTKDKSDENKIKVYNLGSQRGKLWISGAKAILKKPIFGYGLDNLKEEYAKNNIDLDRPHNIVIQIAAYSGVPGMIMYFGAIIIVLIRMLKQLDKVDYIAKTVFFAVIAYLISALFGNSMFYTSPYFLILLGILLSKSINIKEIKN